MKANKKLWIVFYIILLIILVGCSSNALPVPSLSEEQLTIQQNELRFRETVIEKLENVFEYRVFELSEFTPFEWDRVFFFKPNNSIEYIYDKVGYEWDSISEVQNSDGVMRIVFLYEGKVVCYFIDFNLSYAFFISSEKEELLKVDNPKFIVEDFPGSTTFMHNWFLTLIE